MMSEDERGIPGTEFEMKLIGNMTRDELMDEIVNYNREQLIDQDDMHLRQYVINIRLERFKHQLLAEAGMEIKGTFLGNSIIGPEGEEEDNENDS